MYEIRSELLWFIGGVYLFYSRRVAIGTCYRTLAIIGARVTPIHVKSVINLVLKFTYDFLLLHSKISYTLSSLKFIFLLKK